MSRVFVATEASLGRQVVVKVLPPETVAQVSIERFKREIQVAASLQHPHIVPLLSAGETEGLPFYTMPFVKGESLRERLVRGGELSVKDTLHILRDVAAALAYAHTEGVVHRDIKPENIMLSGGVAVVTDFGVAKAIVASGGHRPERAGSAAEPFRSALTSLGVALGTPAYMSPEQAMADVHVDHRADIYSFGCVAYEMLAGSSPFAGRPPQQTLAAHVTELPDPVAKRRPNLPPALATLVMQCLEKRAGDRPQSAQELLAALDAISTPSGGTVPTSARLSAARPRRTMVYVSGAALMALGATLAVWRWASAGKPYRVGTTTPIAVTPALEMEPAISPDGKFVAYVSGPPGGRRVVVQQVSGGRPVTLTSEADGNAAFPSWAPDGSRIVFEAKGAVYAVPALGGTPQRVIEESNGGVQTAAWSPDGKQIAYADGRGLWVRPIGGGTARLLVEGLTVHSPAWAPNGRSLAYIDGIRASLQNLSTSSVWTILLAGGKRTQISDRTHVNISPVWNADGRSVLYLSNREGPLDVYQQTVRGDGSPAGSPLRLTTGLQARGISLSADGSRLAYDVVRNRSNLWMVTINASGPTAVSSATQLTTEGQRIESMSLSHDGQWLAFDSDRSGNFDIYKVRVGGGEPMQLTTSPGNDFHPTWAPDDREIAFHSSRSGKRDIYIIGAEGNGERQVTAAPDEHYAPAWAPDGRRIAFYTIGKSARFDQLITRNADGSWSPPQRITPDSLQAAWISWSPDGKRVAFIDYGMSRLAAGLTGFVGSLVTMTPDGHSLHRLYDRMSSGEPVLYAAWGNDPAVLFLNTMDSIGRVSFWSMPATGGTPRLILRDEPAHRMGRFDFTTDGRRLFFTLAADESDIYVVELKR
jgi:Tol biopolymer transport system component